MTFCLCLGEKIRKTFLFTRKFFAFLSCKVTFIMVKTLENHRGDWMSGLGPLFLFLISCWVIQKATTTVFTNCLFVRDAALS